MRLALRLATASLALLAGCAHPAARASTTPAATVVVLVRHAEKMAGGDADPALTEAGTQRAAALADLPETAGVRAAFVTQYRRTALTAAPVAGRRGITPTVRPIAGDVGAYATALAAEIRARPAGDTVLVVGHSNTVPQIVAALGGPRLPNIDDADYARLFVVTLGGDGSARLREITYGAPSAAAVGAAPMSPVRPR